MLQIFDTSCSVLLFSFSNKEGGYYISYVIWKLKTPTFCISFERATF